MSTKLYEFHGKSYFAKVYDRGDEKYENWNVPLILDSASQNLYDRSGLRLKEKKTKEGEVYYGFKRPWKKLLGENIQTFEAPTVTLNGRKTDEKIGNGSEVAIRVLVYDTRMGKAHRLESVDIKDLVPYGKITDGYEPELIRPEGYEFAEDFSLPPE